LSFYYWFIKNYQLHCFSWKTNPNQVNNHLSIGRRTLFLTPEKGTNFSFPVEHLVYILNKEPAKTIFQVENNKDDIIAQLKGISKLRPEFEKRVLTIYTQL
jgi:predicted AlkP superfamily phosphohydrolase/phosphomutase